MKYHIDIKGKALCGRKPVKNKLRFVPKDKTFDELPIIDQCFSCKRAKER
jgi:hypothetical protein